jgi:perosamine synthetase
MYDPMVHSKQIIYPLKYVDLYGGSDKVTEESFEQHLASFLGENVYVKTLGRARAGLYLLIKLAVRDRRRKVVLSPYTIPDVVNMVRFAGGEPVFVDVVPNSTNLDLEQLADLIDESTCSVIITHYHFSQSSMPEICRLCASKNVMLIEDCALSFGTATARVPSGCAADASVFSFSGFKTLNFVWGGAIATRSPDLARQVRAQIEVWPRLRWSRYFNQVVRIMKYDFLTREPLFSVFTFPFLKWRALRNQSDILPVVRVDSTELDDTIWSRPPMQAIREWDRKLGRVEGFVRHRRVIGSVYIRELEEHLVSKETPKEVRERSGLVNCPIYVDPERRTEIYKEVLARGFDVGLSLYPNAHEALGFEQISGRTKNVSRLVHSVITLPTHPKISEDYAYQLAMQIRRAIHSG